jgi:integrase
VTPTTQKRAVGPLRRPNSAFRSREHLTETEVGKLIEAAKRNRYGHRDATMLLTAYRHGLRASEICDLRWDQIDFTTATLHVRRAKNGKPSTHPIHGDELRRALRKLQREAPKSPFVFMTERGGTFTTDSFNWLVKRAGQKARLPFQLAKPAPPSPPHASSTRRTVVGAVAAGHALPTSALRALLSCYTLRGLLAHDKGHPAFFFDAVLPWRLNLNLNLYVIAEFCIGTEKAFQGEATKVASKDFG